MMGKWAYELARRAVVHGGVCSRDPVGAWWAGRRRLLPADAVDQLHDERVGFICTDDNEPSNKLRQPRARALTSDAERQGEGLGGGLEQPREGKGSCAWKTRSRTR